MKIYEKEWQTVVPETLDKVWEFFGNPHNLEKITPDFMKFQVLSEQKGKTIYPGMFIRYRVSPIASIPITWVTEITAVREQEYFIDEQRAGPYAIWHHEHHFRSTTDGVIMNDRLYYAIPLGFLGQLINQMMISRRIDNIFEYRQHIIQEIFQAPTAASENINR